MIESLEQYFDTAFDSPNGIKELRSLILKLAMMGKLVPQDKNDQPASELLKEIEAEKEKLIAEGKIKKQKLLPEIKADKAPYDVPNGWVWTRLGNITSKITDGDHKTPPRITKGYRLLSAKNVRDGFLDFSTCDYISKEHYSKSRERCLPEKGNLLIVSVGGTIGRTSLVPSDSEFALVRSVALIKPLFWDSNFLKYSMDSELLQNSIHANKRGGAQPCLYLSEISKFLFPLPPLNEQKRIVAKINELMNRCNEMERLKKEQIEKQIKTNKSALHQLMESSNKDSFSSTFNFINNNFSSLYGVKENVDELKKSILQLAMMGKLVPQDKNDQPASELLKEIDAEKEKLIAEGKIKKQKTLPEIKAEEVPYELPVGWVWCRLGDYGIWKSGSTPSRGNPSFYNGNISWVKSGEVKQGFIRNTDEKITEKALANCSLDINPIGSVLIAMYGANIGEVGMLEIEATTNQAVCACTPYFKIDNLYLKHLLESLKMNFIAQGAGAAQPNISRIKIVTTLVPLPPINEQKRIVAKINELMTICDNMIDKIERSEQTQEKLLYSVLSQV